MADRVFHQHPIHEDIPPQWRPDGTIQRTLSYEEAGGYLTFFYNYSTGDDLPGTVTARLNVSIEEDTQIILELDPSKEWRWSHRFDAITTKKDYSMLYGNLLYYDDSDSQYKERPGDLLTWNCRKIKFCARHNSRLHHPDTTQGFSMNIDLFLPNRKVLPITVDPDIKNPPPDPGFEGTIPDVGLLSAE